MKAKGVVVLTHLGGNENQAQSRYDCRSDRGGVRRTQKEKTLGTRETRNVVCREKYRRKKKKSKKGNFPVAGKKRGKRRGRERERDGEEEVGGEERNGVEGRDSRGLGLAAEP